MKVVKRTAETLAVGEVSRRGFGIKHALNNRKEPRTHAHGALSPACRVRYRLDVAGVDRLLTLYGTSDAPVQFGEFAAANISQYTDVVEMFDTFISRVSKVPVHYLKMAGDFPSGEALRMAEAPFISKVEDRQRANGAVWADAMRYAVRLSGMEVEPGALRVNWQSAAPLSDEEKYVRARDMNSLGFSFDSILRELGYEPKQIDTIKQERTEEQEERIRQFNAGVIGGNQP